MNHLKFCSCYACKAGKHAPAAKKETRNIIRANRHNVKVALAAGRETAKCVSAGRTD